MVLFLAAPGRSGFFFFVDLPEQRVGVFLEGALGFAVFDLRTRLIVECAPVIDAAHQGRRGLKLVRTRTSAGT